MRAEKKMYRTIVVDPSTYQKAELVSPLCKLRFEKRELAQKEGVDLDQFGVQQRKVGDRLGRGLALSNEQNRVVTIQHNTRVRHG